jgi:hypothetical protein
LHKFPGIEPEPIANLQDLDFSPKSTGMPRTFLASGNSLDRLYRLLNQQFIRYRDSPMRIGYLLYLNSAAEFFPTPYSKQGKKNFFQIALSAFFKAGVFALANQMLKKPVMIAKRLIIWIRIKSVMISGARMMSRPATASTIPKIALNPLSIKELPLRTDRIFAAPVRIAQNPNRVFAATVMKYGMTMIETAIRMPRTPTSTWRVLQAFASPGSDTPDRTSSMDTINAKTAKNMTSRLSTSTGKTSAIIPKKMSMIPVTVPSGPPGRVVGISMSYTVLFS